MSAHDDARQRVEAAKYLRDLAARLRDDPIDAYKEACENLLAYADETESSQLTAAQEANATLTSELGEWRSGVRSLVTTGPPSSVSMPSALCVIEPYRQQAQEEEIARLRERLKIAELALSCIEIDGYFEDFNAVEVSVVVKFQKSSMRPTS